MGISGRCPVGNRSGKVGQGQALEDPQHKAKGLNFVCRNRGPTQMNWGKARNMSGRPRGSEELQGQQELRWTEEEGTEKQRWI